MSRSLLFVMLMAMGVAQADEVSGPDSVPTATEEKAQTEDEKAQTEEEEAKKEEEAKLISGMSILGNQEAPKSLVIVPWKSSEIGDSLGISTMLDDTRQPIDKEVFMRALIYYEIRSQPTP